ncbi:ras association domain-containing protein 4a isoform X2 [Neoarius graeffei]|uniref:ras association domain-containing protein 4a isoform X2 n=1 Tax=Neoarius graeffei TaxID=443677 RepID=UPI00298D57C7|nr:ras association domain-containing protein 4a isoform X2 [Neoarius graeffei]
MGCPKYAQIQPQGDLRPTKPLNPPLEKEEGGELIMEGLLNISWGLRRPIRLQMQDDHERFHFASAGLWRPESQGRDHRNENQQSPIQLSFESNNNEVTVPAKTSVDGVSSEEETPQIPRTRSDASFMNVLRRSKQRSPGDLQRVKRHRFSINGHFYNHKTSIFTPAYGSVTNVRVSSSMTTQQVLSLLLNKFRVQNKADEFALYVVHESGERTKIKDTEYPLVSRVLHGPCEKIAKIFIMEKDLGEEVTYDVAQYIKFEMPVLNQFVTKLREEEEREISKLTEKYGVLKSMILQQLKDDSESPDGV